MLLIYSKRVIFIIVHKALQP